MLSIFQYIKNIYAKFERPISSLSLVGGFVFDAVTLNRVDEFWENIWVLAHIVIVAVFIILVNSKKHKVGDENNPSEPQFWYVNILQFFFGGLLSTYLVFYFRSADLSTSWLFILLLGVAFWANESLKRQYARLSFQISLFFLSLYALAIYLLPVILHSIDNKVFLLSGGISLIIVIVYVRIIRYWNFEKYNQSKRLTYISIIGIFIVMNVLYFTNVIPPIPLSLKDAGVFHSIQRDSGGNYLAGYEDLGWRKYLKLYDDVSLFPNSPIYVYSAIFSPTDLNIQIVHKWQSYDEINKEWTTKERVELPLIGGREGGYRTYSVKNNLTAGWWRVSIETATGKVLGRVRFNVLDSKNVLNLKYKTL
jgi:hypothetical protein